MSDPEIRSPDETSVIGGKSYSIDPPGTEAARFANRSERSPQPRTAADQMRDWFERNRQRGTDGSIPLGLFERALTEAAHPDLLRIANEQWERGYAVGQQRGAIANTGGLDVERLGKALEWAWSEGGYDPNDPVWVEAIAVEYARLAPQPSTERRRAVPPADPDDDIEHTMSGGIHNEGPPADPPRRKYDYNGPHPFESADLGNPTYEWCICGKQLRNAIHRNPWSPAESEPERLTGSRDWDSIVRRSVYSGNNDDLTVRELRIKLAQDGD